MFIGSSNGIVCAALSHCSRFYNFLAYSRKFFNPHFYLWNPATKCSKRIPSHALCRINVAFVVNGFGFDSIANDFKVVRVVLVESSHAKIAEVYSANNNVWRVVEPPPKNFPLGHVFNVCEKGFLFCVGRDGMIMTFNLNTEVFSCGIKRPTGKRSCTCSVITEYKDSVAIIDYSYDKKSYSEITLWTLNDACLFGGIEESWTLIFKFDVAFSVNSIDLYFNSGDVLLYTSGGRHGVWSLYNLDKKESKSVQVPRHMGPIFKYTDSLVSINGSKQVRQNVHANDN